MSQRLHLTWSSETTPGQCPTCNGNTALLTQSETFDCDEESSWSKELRDGVETGLEVSCHWCPGCGKVTSVSVNGGR